MATDRNRVVGVNAPNPLQVSATRDGSRVLFIASGSTTVEFEADPDGEFAYGGRKTFRLSLLDPRNGATETVRSDNEPRWLGDSARGSIYVEEREEGTRWTRSFSHEQDSSRIVSQYRNGNYDGISPGVLGHRVSMSGWYESSSTDIPETTFFDPSGAPVRENVSIIDVDLFVDGRRVEPQATFRNPANHGVQLPLEVTADIDGETIHTEQTTASSLTGSATRGGSEDRTRELPTFSIPNRTFTDNTLTYTVTPTGWADGWVDPRSTTTSLSGVSVDSVSITDCSISPQQVTVPEEATLTATVSNPTPGQVDTVLRFVLADAEDTTTGRVSGDGSRTFDAVFETTEPGTATGEVFLDDVTPS